MYKKLILFLYIFFIYNTNVFALIETSINPEWEKYINLSEEEKNNYIIIPEKYVYDYKVEYKTPDIITPFAFAETIPSKFNLSNLDGKIYTNTVKKNQSSLGLCWAFATIGSMESNLLLNGAIGFEAATLKCNNNNLDSKYCQYKTDYEINEKYKNREVEDNVTFSERNIDYIVSKPSDAMIYNGTSTYTLISEEYNPYTQNSKIGAGGTFQRAAKLFYYGLSPRRTLDNWEKYNTSMTKMTLEEVFEKPNIDYMVTDYYIYPMKPSNQIAIEDWTNDLKKLIMNYGSTYIDTISPASSECYYYDKDVKMGVINNNGNCGFNDHAMQLIGWDDDFNYQYCVVNKIGYNNYTKDTCEQNGYEWVSGTGAWILKNSWGSSNTYLYLTYESQNLNIAGVRGVKLADFDNRYNSIITNVTKEINTDNIIYKYNKTPNTEYLSQINVLYSSYDAKVNVYISNNGIDYEFIKEDYLDYPGMRSYSLDNYKMDKNIFYIKIEGINSIIETPTIFTKNECSYLNNCDDSIELDTYLEKHYLNNNDTILNVKTKTRNVKSGTLLDYKIFNSKNEDVTNLFEIERNYVLLSDTSAKLNFNNLPLDNYKLKTSYENYTDEIDFFVIDDNFIEIITEDEIFIDDNMEISFKIFDKEIINEITWNSSDESVLKIEDNKIKPYKGGRVTITLVLDTIYGIVTSTKDIIIYDEKISTPQEFLKIFENDANLSKNYLIINDLDFEKIEYDNKIKTFKGIINGNYHTIKNLDVNLGYNRTGIFYKLDNAIIKNLIVNNTTLTGKGSIGTISLYANNSKIQNVYVDSEVNATYTSGGIVGIAENSTCEGCVFAGKVNIDNKADTLYGSGIFGTMSNKSQVINSINKGKIYVNSNYENTTTVNTYASGIANGSGKIINSYNIGEVIAESYNNAYMYGISTRYITVENSYYLNKDNYTESTGVARTESELKIKSNYNNWDFNNIWYIQNDYPVLRNLPIEILDINIDFFSNIINTNSNYIINYIVEPFGNLEYLKIENLTPDLIEINNNNLITNEEEGIAKLKISLWDYSKIIELEIKDIINIAYEEEFVKELPINITTSYFKDNLDGYLKFIYKINNEEKEIKITENEKEFTINVLENGLLEYFVYHCNNECSELIKDSITIKYIDNVNPKILYNYNELNNTLNINILDEKSGLKEGTEFLYSISDNNYQLPENFLKFQNNIKIENPKINYKNKYLWIKNIYDKVDNSICDKEYCIYDLEIQRKILDIKYYDEDKLTLIKAEKYYEDEILKEFIYTKEDENYYYEFLNWTNYKDNLIIKNDLNLYVNYIKISKYIKSDVFNIKDKYIKNIKLKNIYEKYSTKEFLNNIYLDEGFSLDKNNNYISTGLKYRSIYNYYTIVLNGDVTGDGLIKMNDIMKMANHLIDNTTLKNEYLVAGDITGDNELKMNDLMKLANIMVNGGEL